MRWSLKPQPEPQHIQKLAQLLHVDTLVALLLLQRGISTFEEAKRFFRPALADLHHPYLMKDMDKAVERIENAIAKGERLLIYGDYDVDGTTAVSLLSSYLLTVYPNVVTYIPDRFEEGYGISYQGIDFAAQRNISLIVALDCGIKAIDTVAYAKAKGIDFIICDHHNPGAELPQAVAVLDPKRADCGYPYDELCGCGIGFKLVQALAIRRNQPIEELLPYLDLVVMAIAADIVPMTGENRVLAYFGLKAINSTPRAGIKALIHQLSKQEVTISDVVFMMAPRINAAGRMKHGQHAVNLLTETNVEKALALAKEIEIFNTDRRALDQHITDEALQQILKQNEQEKNTTVVYGETWHKGVIGIVASRLTETYYRPTVVFTKSGDILAASARSVKDFDVYNALEACADYLEQFGGHKYAAGLTLKQERYSAFKQKFEDVVSATIDKRLLTPELAIDAEINLSDITPKLYRVLKQFSPFGPGNRTPVFMTQQVQDTGYGKGVGEEGKHLNVFITQNGSQPIGGIGFNLGHKFNAIINKKLFKAAYSIDENEWNGGVRLQLKIRDIE